MRMLATSLDNCWLSETEKRQSIPIPDWISFPDNFCNIVDSIEALKNSVFPDIQNHFNDHKWLCERAILAPKNNSVSAINLQIQDQLPGRTTSYKSVDSVADIDESVQYPIEFLYSLEPSGMPPHNLLLKVGTPIMLLRNLDAPRLCNGTRLCVKKSHASRYRGHHPDRLRKRWRRVLTTNPNDPQWYAIRVQTSAVSSTTRLRDVHQQSARTIA